MVEPGVDLLDKLSAVSLPEGTRAYASRVNGKRVIKSEHLDWFTENGGRLLISYENYAIERFSSDKLNHVIFERFGRATQERNLLVLRDPFNMLPSAEKMVRNAMVAKQQDEKWVIEVLNKRLALWKNYAFLHLNPDSITRGEFVTLLFDRWVKEKDYRDSMANKLGYINHDRFLDFISDAGKGSSFSGSKLESKSDVLSRWEAGNLSSRLLMKHPEVIDYTALIFGEEAIPEGFLTTSPSKMY